jgi:hypothetical protein
MGNNIPSSDCLYQGDQKYINQENFKKKYPDEYDIFLKDYATQLQIETVEKQRRDYFHDKHLIEPLWKIKDGGRITTCEQMANIEMMRKQWLSQIHIELQSKIDKRVEWLAKVKDERYQITTGSRLGSDDVYNPIHKKNLIKLLNDEPNDFTIGSGLPDSILISGLI